MRIDTYVVRFGNHWLQTDAMQTRITWVADLAAASVHDRDWANQFAGEQRAHGRTVYVYRQTDAWEQAEAERNEVLRRVYVEAFRTALQPLCPQACENIPGVGNPPYAFVVDKYFAEKVPAVDGAARFAAAYAGGPTRTSSTGYDEIIYVTPVGNVMIHVADGDKVIHLYADKDVWEWYGDEMGEYVPSRNSLFYDALDPVKTAEYVRQEFDHAVAEVG